MSDWLHDPLRDRFTAIADLRDDSDWLDVRRRARRAARRRAMVTVAAAAAALLLLAAPAFALHRVVVSFFESEPAPQRVQLDFARMELGAPKALAPGAIPDQTRKVIVPTAAGGETFVWVAPTRSGGFCTRWQVPTGGCRSRTVGGPIGAGWMGRTDELTFLYGAVVSDDAERLELRFQDGAAIDVPLTWVSPPIDAGFYFVEIPPAHLEPGARPSELVLYSDGGDVLATEQAPVRDPLDESDPTTGVPRVVRYEVGRKPWDSSTHGVYPCAKEDELDLGLGVTTCP